MDDFDGLPGSHRNWALAALWLAMVMAVLDASIANVALPTIARDLNAAPSASVGMLVGRSDELAAVLAVCRGSAAGTTRFVTLRGEAGIGKTRLAEEVAARAEQEGQIVAWGRCWEHEGTPALWPWIQVVRALFPFHPALDVDPVAALAHTGTHPRSQGKRVALTAKP